MTIKWKIQKTSSSSKSRDTANGVPSDSQKDHSSNSSHNQEEPKENDSTNPSSPKDSSSPSTVKRVHKPITPLHHYPYRMKKKDQVNVDKIRETFS